MDFDQKIWADEAGIYKKPYPRQQMLASLKKTALKVGTPKATIVSMLGAATKTDKFAEHGLVYVLGPEPGAISVDSQWLVIDFDGDQKVKSFDVVTD